MDGMPTTIGPIFFKFQSNRRITTIFPTKDFFLEKGVWSSKNCSNFLFFSVIPTCQGLGFLGFKEFFRILGFRVYHGKKNEGKCFEKHNPHTF